MSYSPTVPQNSDSPSIFPAQAQANFTRLQTLVGADHQFNLTAAANDGYHNLIHMTQQAPAGGLAAIGRSYAKSSGGAVQQFYMDDAGREYQITPSMPIRAAVNFDGRGGIAPQTIRSRYNVNTVDKTATGSYNVTFTNPMPDINYIVQVTGMAASTGNAVIGVVRGDSTYSGSVGTTLVSVAFYNTSNSRVDVIMGNVTIFSVS